MLPPSLSVSILKLVLMFPSLSCNFNIVLISVIESRETQLKVLRCSQRAESPIPISISSLNPPCKLIIFALPPRICDAFQQRFPAAGPPQALIAELAEREKYDGSELFVCSGIGASPRSDCLMPRRLSGPFLGGCRLLKRCRWMNLMEQFVYLF